MTYGAALGRLLAPTLLLAVFAGGCSDEAPDNSPPAPLIQGDAISFRRDSPQLTALESQPVGSETGRTLTIAGRLVWDESRTTRVYAPVAGQIVRVLAIAGDRVQKGQPLAYLASPEMGQAQAEARRAAADIALAEKNLARARELDSAGVIAKRELQTAETELARAQAEHARTSARLRTYGATDEVDQMFPLRSPIDGTVVERNANVGQEFRPDQSGAGTPPLFVLSDPTRLWVQLEVPEAAIAVVHRGQVITLKVGALPDTTIPAKIDFVSDTLDPQTRTLRARASAPNNARKLKAEMFVSAEVQLAGEEAPVVPAKSVLLINDRYYVFIDAGDGRFVRRPVKAQDAGVETMRILEGIKPQEKVVTVGTLLLEQIFDGQRN